MLKLTARACSFFFAALLVLPVGADWLVTQDGDRVETKGAWKVKGKMVVFTATNGTLTSIRASEVDLDASAVATERAKNPPPAADPQKENGTQSAVLVITDKDIKSATPEPEPSPVAPEGTLPGEEGEAEGEGEEGEEAEAEAQVGTLAVESWRIAESDQVDGVEVFGSLRNGGTEIAAELSMVVRVMDEDGNQLVEQGAFLKNSSLLPGRATSFRVLLPGLPELPTDPVFEIKSRGIKIN